MKIIKQHTAKKLDRDWDGLGMSVYQKKKILLHAERYNFCNQRYYLAYQENKLVAGAIVYSLKVNVLTFVKYSIKLPMVIIGVPMSVDASGLIGDLKSQEKLLDHILEHESGLILCLNYEISFNNKCIIEMRTLPTLVQDFNTTSWEEYLESLRHQYRKRVLKAENKFKNTSVNETTCSNFTKEHYKLYLDVMARTNTKLETLTYEFFINLPDEYKLVSSYENNLLLTWHISTFSDDVYYFFLGGINYTVRDKYESYLNNLIQVIKKGVSLNSNSINLGQTAEIPKKRFGAKLIDKRMFLFHRNNLIRFFFKIIRNFLSNNKKIVQANVYKTRAVTG